MPPTVYDIAKAAGYSQPTVSDILSGKGSRYRKQTAELVQRTAREMGYRVNVAARTTSSGKFGSVALVMGSMEGRSSLPQPLLSSLQNALDADDLSLVLVRLHEDSLKDASSLPRVVRESATDGMLLDYTHGIPGTLDQLISRHTLPAVWMNTLRETNAVHPNDRDAGRRATQHLLEQGHRRIVYADFTHGPDFPIPHYSAAHRREGYTAAMIDAGLTPQLWVPTTGRDISSPERVSHARQLLQQPNRPTAVVCYSSTVYIPILLAATGLGIEVPRDLSLMSFEDIPIGYLGPGTCMIVPHAQVGTAAVAMLRDRIANPTQKHPSRLIDFSFEAGASVARAPLDS